MVKNKSIDEVKAMKPKSPTKPKSNVVDGDYSFNLFDFPDNCNAWIQVEDQPMHPKDLIIARDGDGNIHGIGIALPYDFGKQGKGIVFGIQMYGFDDKIPMNLQYVSYKKNEIFEIGAVAYQPNVIFGKPLTPLKRKVAKSIS
jgi:hypothetical protein